MSVTLVFVTPPSRPGYDCNLLPCWRQLLFAKYFKNTHHSHDVITKQLWPEEVHTEDFFQNFKRITATKGGGRALSILWVGHGWDSRGNRLRFPERARDFPLFKSVQTCFAAHPIFHSLGTGGSSPGSKATGTRESIKIGGSEWVELLCHSPHVFMVCTRTTLPSAVTSQESFSFCCWRPQEDYNIRSLLVPPLDSYFIFPAAETNKAVWRHKRSIFLRTSRSKPDEVGGACFHQCSCILTQNSQQTHKILVLICCCLTVAITLYFPRKLGRIRSLVLQIEIFYICLYLV